MFDHGNHDHNSQHDATAELDFPSPPKRKGFLAPHTIRHERATGEMVGGKLHTQKGEQYVRALENWLRRNPGASGADRAAAQSMLDDLRGALGGK